MHMHGDYFWIPANVDLWYAVLILLQKETTLKETNTGTISRKIRMPMTPRANLQKPVRGLLRGLLMSALTTLPFLFVLFAPVHLQEGEACHTEKKEREREWVNKSSCPLINTYLSFPPDPSVWRRSPHLSAKSAFVWAWDYKETPWEIHVLSLGCSFECMEDFREFFIFSVLSRFH